MMKDEESKARILKAEDRSDRARQERSEAHQQESSGTEAVKTQVSPDPQSAPVEATVEDLETATEVALTCLELTDHARTRMSGHLMNMSVYSLKATC